MRSASRRTVLLVALCGLAVLAVLPASASAKVPVLFGYTVSVSSPINGGTTTTLTATVADEGLLSPVESAVLLPPAPINVIGATLPAGMPQPIVTSCGKSAVQCVELPDLDLGYGQSATVTMTVTTPPACSAVTGTWGAVARPDGLLGLLTRLLGLPGLPLDTAHSSLTTTVTDSCHLAFEANHEPHSAVKSPQVITDTDYTPPPAGGPVKVDVLDVNNNIVTNSTAQVTAAIGHNAGGTATLGGAVIQNAVAGVATFANLTLNLPADGYTLTASNPAMTQDTSSPFDIADQGSTCGTSKCTESESNSSGSATVTGTGTNPTGMLVESVNPSGGALTCAGYTSADPNTYQFFATDQGLTKQLTIDITQPPTNIGLPPFSASDNNGFDSDGDYDDVLATQQICFNAPYLFMDTSGNMVHTGLLPDCGEGVTGPCHDRSQDTVPQDTSASNGVGYDIILHATIPANLAGDPRIN